MTNITAQDRRVQYTGNNPADAGPFSFSFQVNATSEIKVYVDSTVKTLTTHYTVSLSADGTGSISFTSGNFPTNAQTITIMSNIPISRTSQFTTGGTLTASALETEFNNQFMQHQQADQRLDRALLVPEHDTISGADFTLPAKSSRLGAVLGFNATTGNPEAGPAITAVQSLADVTTAINLLGTSAVVTDMGLLANSAVIEDMGLLATSGNITAMGLLGVSSVITDMGLLGNSAVIEDMGFLGTSANVTAMGHLGTSANVTAMGKLGNDATVADMAILGTDDVVADMAQLANSTIIDDLAILANSTITDDMAILATTANVTAMGHLGTSANVTAMGVLGTSSNVTAMGNLGTTTNVTNMANLNASGVITNIANLNASGVVSNIATVAGVSSNVTTVASNISGVNSFAERYRVASSAPTSSLDVGDLYFDTTANEVKVYKSSGWANVGSTVNGTSARFTYNISGTPTSVTGADANGNTLAYDAGFVDVYLNGVRLSGADITTTSGDTVTFASALANGDVVDIVGFGTFNVASINASNINSGTIPSARFGGAIISSWETKTSAFNVEAGRGYFVDTSSSAVTATLPASPTAGDTVRFIDLSATFDTNNLTVARNSKKIQGDASDLTVATERAGLALVFSGDTQGWLLMEK